MFTSSASSSGHNINQKTREAEESSLLYNQGYYLLSQYRLTSVTITQVITFHHNGSLEIICWWYNFRQNYFCLFHTMGFPGGTMVKNLPSNAGDARDVGLILRSERSLGEGNGNPLQYSCLENSMDRGAWWIIVHGVSKSQKWLSMGSWFDTINRVYHMEYIR